MAVHQDFAHLSDALFTSAIAAYVLAMAFYTALTRLTDTDPELEDALKPAVEFMARRPRPEPAAYHEVFRRVRRTKDIPAAEE